MARCRKRSGWSADAAGRAHQSLYLCDPEASRNLATIGPSEGPPWPPSTTANTMSPLNPISQASVGGGLPLAYSAVPVFA